MSRVETTEASLRQFTDDPPPPPAPEPPAPPAADVCFPKSRARSSGYMTPTATSVVPLGGEKNKGKKVTNSRDIQRRRAVKTHCGVFWGGDRHYLPLHKKHRRVLGIYNSHWNPRRQKKEATVGGSYLCDNSL